MKDKTVIIDGFSKTYAMTGWRLGYGIMRRNLAEKITQLMVNSNSCTCAFSQMAGVEALKGPQDEVQRMVEEFKKRREVMVSGLNKLDGVTCKKPQATFYVFPNVKSLNMSSQKIQNFWLNEAGVATLAGTSFGEFGEGYMRLSFANSISNIQKALGKIESALQTL